MGFDFNCYVEVTKLMQKFDLKKLWKNFFGVIAASLI
jgi:hypothetical protein